MGDFNGSLSLRPDSQLKEEEDSIPYIIRRVNEERRHFRHVTEESLLQEIAAGENDEAGESSTDEPRDREARIKEVFTKKAEMIGYVDQARVEIQTALDFVSFLLSKERAAAKNTMSPGLLNMLSQHLGTFSFDKIEPRKPTPAKISEDKEVKLGATIGGLKKAADTILAAAKRLEKDLEEETTYWHGMMALKRQGWAVCRMQRQRAVGVQYGFLEAGPNFKQSLAAIRPDENGDLRLDAGARRQPRALRVRVHRPDGISETSQVPSALPAGSPLEKMIRQTRDSLLDEELFYEATKEARTLLAYGVKIKMNTIHASMTNDHHIQIDLVPFASVEPSSSKSDNVIAESLLLMLRMSMMAIYRRRAETRSKLPPPMSSDNPAPPVEAILRPILDLQMHDAAVSRLSSYLSESFGRIRAAGVKVSTDFKDGITMLIEGSTGSSKVEALQALLASLSRPLCTVLEVSINERAAFKIRVRTFLGAPCYGVEYNIRASTPAADKASVPTATVTLTDRGEVEQHVRQLLAVHLAFYISSMQDRFVHENGAARLRSKDAGLGQIYLDVGHREFAVKQVRPGQSPRLIANWSGGDNDDSRTLLAAVQEI